MAKGSDNPFPSILLVEGSTPASPSAGDQRLFIDSADNKLKRVDSSGTVTTIEGGGGGGGGTTGQTRAFASGTAQSVTLTTSWQAVQFNNEDFDDLAAHDNVTNNTRFAAAATGRYRFSAQVALASLPSGHDLLGIYKNSQATGTRLAVIEWNQNTTTEYVKYITSGVVELTAGDYVEVYVNLSGGTSTTILTSTTSDVTWAVLERLS